MLFLQRLFRWFTVDRSLRDALKPSDHFQAENSTWSEFPFAVAIRQMVVSVPVFRFRWDRIELPSGGNKALIFE